MSHSEFCNALRNILNTRTNNWDLRNARFKELLARYETCHHPEQGEAYLERAGKHQEVLEAEAIELIRLRACLDNLEVNYLRH